MLMKATLSDLARRTSKVVRPAIHAHQVVEITEHGKVCCRIVPVRRATKEERKAALKALMAIGPIDLPSRK